MSVTFTQVSIAAHGPILDLFERVAGELLTIGVAPRGTVRSFAFDPDEGEYAEGDSLGVTALQCLSGKREPREIDGLSARFGDENLEVSIRMAVQEAGTTICFMDMSDRALYGCFKDENEARIHQLMVACAQGCGCPASFGAMELEWQPYDEARIVSAIVDGPEGYEGQPPPFCLLNQNDYPVPGIKDADPRFDAVMVGGYWVLQRQGLGSLYASLAR